MATSNNSPCSAAIDPPFLRRYTSMSRLTELLRKQELTFLNPTSWTDTNDSHFLAVYKKKRGLKSVLALCFAQIPETYHYWHIFAPGPTGVCIQFKKQSLVEVVQGTSGVRAEAVKYRTIEELRAMPLLVNELPFTKRYGFQDEQEFRFIYSSRDKALTKLCIPFPLSCIDRIMLSPTLPPSHREERKNQLLRIKGCGALEIYRSTLTGNKEWKGFGDAAQLN